MLIGAERIERVEPRGLSRRIESEEDSNRGGEAERKPDRLRRDEGPPFGQIADCVRASQTQDNPDDAPDERERDRLDQELGKNVAASGADGHPQQIGRASCRERWRSRWSPSD